MSSALEKCLANFYGFSLKKSSSLIGLAYGRAQHHGFSLGEELSI